MTAEPTDARIFVVIAAFNEAGAVRGVVDGLLGGSSDRKLQVVVVDDGSSDGTADSLAGSGASVLRRSPDGSLDVLFRIVVGDLGKVVWQCFLGYVRPGTAGV